MKAGVSMTRRITFLSGTFLLFLLFTFCSRETLLPLLCNRWYQKTIQRQTQLHAGFQHGQMRLNETVLQIMASHVKVYLSSSVPRASIAWIGWFRWLTNWCSGGSGNQLLINVRLYIYIALEAVEASIILSIYEIMSSITHYTKKLRNLSCLWIL